MISKCLSTSERYASLEQYAGTLAEFCQALFPLLVAHSDDWGCQQGDAFTIKHLVHPASPRTMEDFHAALTALHNVGLVTWYESDGKWFVYIRGHFTHQDLKGHDKDGRKRQIPEPPENPSEIQTLAQIPPNSPKLPLREGKGREVKGSKEKGSYLSSADADYERFRAAYPASRRVGGAKARTAFRVAERGVLLDTMLASLEQQKRSEQWQTPSLIPLMTTWLNQERWTQQLPEPTLLTSGNPKTAGNLSALQRFVERAQ